MACVSETRLFRCVRFISTSSLYRCCFVCKPTVCFLNVHLYIMQSQNHSNVPNFHLQCCVDGCCGKFRGSRALHMRICQLHAKLSDKHRGSNESTGQFQCTQAFCKHQLVGLHNLMDHLHCHIKDSIKIKCSFAKCDKKFDRKPQFGVRLNWAPKKLVKHPD